MDDLSVSLRSVLAEELDQFGVGVQKLLSASVECLTQFKQVVNLSERGFTWSSVNHRDVAQSPAAMS